MLKHSAALAIMIALSGCGNSENAADGTPENGAAAVNGAAASGAVAGALGVGASTADLPAFVELPSGATTINNMRVNDDDKTGGTVTLQTAQKPAEIIAFYRASMAKNGLKIGLENVSDQVVQLLGQSEDESRSLMVTVIVDDAGTATLNLVHSSTTVQPTDESGQ